MRWRWRYVGVWLLASASMTLMPHQSVAQSAAQSNDIASTSEVRALLDVLGKPKEMVESDTNKAQLLWYQWGLDCVPMQTVTRSLAGDSTEQAGVNAMVDAYRRSFTRDEIEALLAFFSSPVGKKWNSKARFIDYEFGIAHSSGFELRANRMIDSLKKQGLLNEQGRCPSLQPIAPARATTVH